MSTAKFEALVIALGKQNGAFDDPESRAFQLKNPMMLRSYRPEKKVDDDHYRIFTSIMGGFKAAISDLQAKCSGKNNKLTKDNTLGDMLKFFGIEKESATRPIILFMRRALKDESITLNTPLYWFEKENE